MVNLDEIETEEKISFGDPVKYKNYFILFIILLFADTSIFADYVLGIFGSNTHNGLTLSPKGFFIKAFLIVIIYMLAVWLAERGYLD